MAKSHKAVLVLLVLSAFIFIFSHYHFKRYEFIPVGQARSFMVDRYTGEIWYLFGARKTKLVEQEDMSAKEGASSFLDRLMKE